MSRIWLANIVLGVVQHYLFLALATILFLALYINIVLGVEQIGSWRGVHGQSCHGMDWNLEQCGLGGSTYFFNQGICYQGSISVKSPKGNINAQSASVACKGSCEFFCYTDNKCTVGKTSCIPGYTGLTCQCTNINFSWDIHIAGSQVFSWQVY